jgi:hypothetical protein
MLSPATEVETSANVSVNANAGVGTQDDNAIYLMDASDIVERFKEISKKISRINARVKSRKSKK